MNPQKKQKKLYVLSDLRKKIWSGILFIYLFTIIILNLTTNVIAFSSVYKDGRMPENTLQSEIRTASPADSFGSSIYKKRASDNTDSAQNEIGSITKDETELTGPSFYKSGPLPGIPSAQIIDPGNTAIDTINLLGRPSLYKNHSEKAENTASPEMIETQTFTGSPFKKHIQNDAP